MEYEKNKQKSFEDNKNESDKDSRLENDNTKESLSNLQLAAKSLEAAAITGIGTGAMATYFFDYGIGIATGIVSAGLNVYGVFYRNNHYEDYYS